MLSQLYFENIAVIEKASIDLNKGLNVLTGETGAGKSILIDSINAVLGERISRELVRTGSHGARVSALFSELSPELLSKIRELGYDGEEDSILLQRDISPEGKSVCRINGRPATAAILREVGGSLLNIHGQHENYELLSPDLHMAYIDRMEADVYLLSEYQSAYFHWTELQKKIEGMRMDESEKARRMDLLRFQTESGKNWPNSAPCIQTVRESSPALLPLFSPWTGMRTRTARYRACKRRGRLFPT